MVYYDKNIIYILLIDNFSYYIGCHCISHRPVQTYNDIVSQSGNPLIRKVRSKEITFQEYLDRINLISVEEFSTPEEARNREKELIKEYKEKYPLQTLNTQAGNPNFGFRKLSEETKQKISNSMKGHPCSSLTKHKMAQAKIGRPSNATGCKHSEESIRRAKETRLLNKGKKS